MLPYAKQQISAKLPMLQHWVKFKCVCVSEREGGRERMPGEMKKVEMSHSSSFCLIWYTIQGVMLHCLLAEQLVQSQFQCSQ